jgi:hypothetical protein
MFVPIIGQDPLSHSHSEPRRIDSIRQGMSHVDLRERDGRFVVRAGRRE